MSIFVFMYSVQSLLKSVFISWRTDILILFGIRMIPSFLTGIYNSLFKIFFSSFLFSKYFKCSYCNNKMIMFNIQLMIKSMRNSLRKQNISKVGFKFIHSYFYCTLSVSMIPVGYVFGIQSGSFCSKSNYSFGPRKVFCLL